MSAALMQAIRFHQYGGPEVLVLEQVPRPQPQPGQVIFRVLAAGVNPADWKIRAGYFKEFMPLPLPWIPGLDGAGIVESVGSGVTSFQKGQEVYGVFTGAYAEYAAAPADDLQPKPANLTFEGAASVPVGALTAWQAVIEEANVQPGQRILVHGAAGGVGMFAVQLARWKGAHVAGTASAKNIEYIRSLGVETAIDYNAAPFETLIHDLDAVIDTVGGDLPGRSLKTLRRGGILVTVAAQLQPEMGQEHGVQAVSAGRAPAGKLREISELLQTQQLIPLVGEVFPLAEARKAQELSQTGHGRGRILLRTSPP